LRQAFLSGDAVYLSDHIDFPAVRASLKRAAEQLDLTGTTNGIPLAMERWGNSPFLVDLIETQVTGEGLVKPGSEATENRSWSGTVRSAFFQSLGVFTVRVDDLQFSLPLAGLGWFDRSPTMVIRAPEVQLLFAFSNLRWQLAGVELPKRGTCEVTLPPSPQTLERQRPPDTRKAVSWTGYWRLSTRQSLSLTQVGNQVTGAVLPVGCAVRATVSGNHLSGTCVVGREVARLDFTMQPDGDSFSGTMRCQSGRRSFRWDGQRISEVPTSLPATARRERPGRR
jgi:hypothetical protein